MMKLFLLLCEPYSHLTCPGTKQYRAITKHRIYTYCYDISRYPNRQIPSLLHHTAIFKDYRVIQLHGQYPHTGAYHQYFE